MALPTATDYVRTQPAIAAPLQAADVLPDPYHPPVPPYVTVIGTGVPADLPVPVSVNHGVFVPATAEEPDIIDYDPWLWAMPAKILDHSRPVHDVYGGPSGPGKGGALVAEWGGQPAPVRDYQDTTKAVLLSPRQMSYHTSSGPAGQFYGPQQTAWEAAASTPVGDYWSTVILGAH